MSACLMIIRMNILSVVSTERAKLRCPTFWSACNVYGDRGPSPALHDHRLLAPSAMDGCEHVGSAAGYLHDGPEVSREVSGRHGDPRQRPGTRGPGHPDPRR